MPTRIEAIPKTYLTGMKGMYRMTAKPDTCGAPLFGFPNLSGTAEGAESAEKAWGANRKRLSLRSLRAPRW